MPKNIVLLSDGTGNSSALLFPTNVWRLYQALDLSDPTLQVACYDNGVGSSSFKPLAYVTGVFGFGLKRNVIHLYSFLCRNYDKDDRIFGFGFSRGAFTMRIVAGLVARAGLMPYCRKARNAEAELAHNAKAAYRDYHEQFHTRFRIEWPLRWILRRIRNRCCPPAPPDQRQWPRIHFLGLWDTVDAYGGPIEEITRAIDYWLWPLSILDRQIYDSKDGIKHDSKIDRACHAVALDDERRAFWPELWEEFDRDTRERLPVDPDWSPPDIVDIPQDAAIDKQRLSQVWFAGVHADVGGGYPQNGLSYVTLDWMMDRALVYRLRLKPQETERLRRSADGYDKLNDSRHGLAGYYRYQPRKVNFLRKAGPKYAKLFDDIHSFRTTIRHPFTHDDDSDVDDGLCAGSKYPPNDSRERFSTHPRGGRRLQPNRDSRELLGDNEKRTGIAGSV